MNKKKLSVSVLCLTVLIAAVFILNGAAPNLFAQGKSYELKYQLAKGTKFIMTSTGEVNSVMDQMGTEVLTDVNGEQEDIFVVLASDKKTGLKLEYEFGKRSQDINSAMGSDSTDFSELIGKKVNFVLLPNGKVEGFEGFETLPTITVSSGEELNEETYILTVKTTFPMLPDKPVKFGDTWKDIQNMDIPLGESVLKSENEFTYTLIEEAEKDGFASLKIEVKGTSKLSGDFEQGGMALFLERDTTTTGIMYFAYKEGMMISSETESLGEGVINVLSAGVDIPQTTTSKGTVAVRFEK